jgi:hypothetical protein
MIDAQTAEALPDTAESKHELRGSLFLFVLWLGVIGPIYSFGLNGFFAMRWTTMYPAAGSYYASWDFWAFVAAREVSRVLAAIVMMVRRSADAVWFAILVLWLSGPALVTGAWLLSGAVIVPGALVRSSAVAAAATIYLLRSRHVRAVYAIQAPGLGAAVSAIRLKLTSTR